MMNLGVNGLSLNAVGDIVIFLRLSLLVYLDWSISIGLQHPAFVGGRIVELQVFS